MVPKATYCVAGVCWRVQGDTHRKGKKSRKESRKVTLAKAFQPVGFRQGRVYMYRHAVYLKKLCNFQQTIELQGYVARKEASVRSY